MFVAVVVGVTGLAGTVRIGGVASGIAGGRAFDGWLERGHIDARIVAPAASLLAMSAVLTPAVIITSLYVSFPVAVLAARFLSVAGHSLYAARLDVIPSTTWARADAAPIVLTLARRNYPTNLATAEASEPEPSKVPS